MSLFPLGLLSQGGGANGGAAAFELISTAYGTGSSGTITFSSIPSTYKHLQIRYTGKITWGIEIAVMSLRFNSDSASNYNYHRMYDNAPSVASDSSGGTITEISTFTLDAGATGNELVFGAGVIDILDFASTTKNKTVRGLTGVKNSGSRISLSSGLWRSTSAVTSLSLIAPVGNFTTTSRFSLYGIRG